MAAKTSAKQTKPREHTTRLVRDTLHELPQLYWSIYIAGERFEQIAFANMFVRAACHSASTPEEADLVVFTGGSDVNPELYGADLHKTTSFNRERDERDMALYETCYEKGIPMFGVCRGAQFLHVMNGGELYQHVDKHNNGSHRMIDAQTGEDLANISSNHHQMCIENSEMDVLGYVELSTRRERGSGNLIDVGDKNHRDVEAFFYRDSLCFGVQGHPEYKGYGRYTKWCMNTLYEVMQENPDCALDHEGMLRLKDEYLEERILRMKEGE